MLLTRMHYRRRARPYAFLLKRDPVEASWIRYWALTLLTGFTMEQQFAGSPEDFEPLVKLLELSTEANSCWGDDALRTQRPEVTLRQRVTWLRRLAKATPRPNAEALSRRQQNLRALSAYLGLSRDECWLFELCVFMTSDPALMCLASQIGSLSGNETSRLLAGLLDLPLADVEDAFRPEGLLRTTRLVNIDKENRADPSLSIEVLPGVALLLESETFDATRFLDKFAESSPAATLATTDFPHLTAATKLIKRLLTNTVRTHTHGINILIYGEPGTGKSEYVRALAAELRLESREVRTADDDGDPLEGYPRASAYQLAQQLFRRTQRSLLVFEELEDMFAGLGADTHPLSVVGRRGIGKGWFNRMLEANPVPTIWLSNEVEGLDPAYLRRFSYVMEMPPPPRSVRKRILKRYFGGTPARSEWIDHLAENRLLVPSLIEQSARVAGALNMKRASEFEREAERVLSGTLRAMGHHRPLSAHRNTAAGYNLAYVNTDIELGPVLAALAHGREGRLCLYGPPGTGKTEFARHVAQALDRPLLVKRASDVLSMWWGGTEANIARMFREAEADNAVLLVDEVDSILKDRGTVQHSWESSQVNELLTQMEGFRGIFIASTNVVDHIDSAALRRFDFKVKFDYMTPEQRIAMFETVLRDTGGQHGERSDSQVHNRLKALDTLTPGDFAVALRQASFSRRLLDALQLLEVLEAECAHKTRGRPRAIGFTGTF